MQTESQPRTTSCCTWFFLKSLKCVPPELQGFQILKFSPPRSESKTNRRWEALLQLEASRKLLHKQTWPKAKHRALPGTALTLQPFRHLRHDLSNCWRIARCCEKRWNCDIPKGQLQHAACSVRERKPGDNMFHHFPLHQNAHKQAISPTQLYAFQVAFCIHP